MAFLMARLCRSKKLPKPQGFVVNDPQVDALL